jgi:hypothetical protein
MRKQLSLFPGLVADDPAPKPEPQAEQLELEPARVCEGGAWGCADRCLHHEGLPINGDGLCQMGREEGRPLWKQHADQALQALESNRPHAAGVLYRLAHLLAPSDQVRAELMSKICDCDMAELMTARPHGAA